MGDPVSLGVQMEATKVSVLGGHVVWSARDAATGRFRLMHWSNGLVEALPVPERSVQFDADLGVDSAQRIVVTYSRCAREPQWIFNGAWPLVATSRACRPVQLRIGDTRERTLGRRPPRGHTWMLPSRWGSRLLVVDATAKRNSALVRALKVGSSGLGKALPRGAGGFDEPAGPATVDLRGHRLAYDWYSNHQTGCLDTNGDAHGVADEFDLFSGYLRGPVGLTQEPIAGFQEFVASALPTAA